MKRNSKKTLLIGSASLLAVVLGVTVMSHTASKGGLFAYRTKAANYESLSVTFNTNSTVVSGSIQSYYCILASNLEVSGIQVRATINNSSTPTTESIARFNGDSASVAFSIGSNSAGVTKFQSISSISFGYKNDSYSGNMKIMWSKDNYDWTTITASLGTTIQSLPAGAHYLKVINDNGYAHFNSFTLNYSCSETPTSDTYNISYCSYDFSEDERIELEGIDTTSLEYSAIEGETVVVEPEALEGYQFAGAFEYYTNFISDFSVQNGVITFTMPSHNVELVLIAQSTSVELSSISLSGSYPTEFTVGDSFSSTGLVVTAHYSDGSSATVTPDSITGYDMSTAGEQTVTVSYTESEITKTASYGITVVSDTSDVTIVGTYNYVSRTTEHVTEYYTPKDWTGKMTLTFTSNGKCTWSNVWSDSNYSYDCKVFFDYIAVNNGINISLSMTVCSGSSSDKYDYKRNNVSGTSASYWSGGYYDRPADNGITVDGAGTTGVFTLNKSTLQIKVYEYVSLSKTYEEYDTFTFVLAA